MKISNTIKEQLYSKLKYTSQTFDEMMLEFIEIAESDIFPTRWQNLTDADPLVGLFAIFAAHKDIFNYMLDYRLQEAYMSTAKERTSVLRLADSYGYKVPGYSAARNVYEIPAGDFNGNQYIIEPFTKFVDDNNTEWIYVGDGKTPKILKHDDNTIELYQGYLTTITFDGDQVTSEDKDFVIGSQRVAFDNVYNNDAMAFLTYEVTGEEFTYADINTLSRFGDTYFDLRLDVLDLIYIQFPKTLNLNRYPGQFKLNYIITKGKLDQSPTDIGQIVYDSSGNDYSVTFSPVPGEFYTGKNPANVEEIREGYQRYKSNAGSLITVENYKDFILYNQKDIPSVVKCTVLDNSRDTNGGLGIPELNNLLIHIYLVKKLDNGDLTHILTTSERNKIQNTIRGLKGSGVTVQVNPGALSGETIKVNLKSKGTISQLDLVENTIREYILETKEIGDSITVSELTTLVVEKGLAKYFTDGLGLMLEIESVETYSHQLKLDEYINNVEFGDF